MSNRGRHKKSHKHLIVQILGKTIADRMMNYQIEQGNPPNLDIFLRNPVEGQFGGGFIWDNTQEGHAYWDTLLVGKLINHHLYKKWKNDRSQKIYSRQFTTSMG